MDRRGFLRTAGLAALAPALNGCARLSGRPATSTGSGKPVFDPVAAVAPGAERGLSVLSGSFEQLVGQRPFAFGLVTADNTPLRGAEVAVWVVPADPDPRPTGPFAAAFHDVALSLGAYVAEVDIPAPGVTAFVAVTGNRRAGSDELQVTTPASSRLPAPGEDAVAVATPTWADPRGVARVCTADPPCGMHEASLHEVLGQRPVVVIFATPAFCRTAMCAPAVDTLEAVRTARDWHGIAFVHVEIYSDAGHTLAEPVERWQLPTEPWLFTVDADGRIVDRADGALLAVPEEVVEALVAGLS